MKATKRILDYLGLLPFSFLLFAVAWMVFAPSCRYHCWDDCPPLGISWAPPFIHPWANSADGKLRDYYHLPEGVVYLIWFSFIVGTLLLPALYVAKCAETEHMKSHNYRPGVDAGWPLLFACSRPWPRATQAGRWAK